MHTLLTQHKKFIKLSKKDHFVSQYMNLIAHTEFGPNYLPIKNKSSVFNDYFDINHWLEQWYLTYLDCLKKDYWAKYKIYMKSFVIQKIIG